MQNEHMSDGFGDDDGNGNEEIIDEEELMLLREMKDLKKSYRENFDKLKVLKTDIADMDQNITNSKQQLISSFEQWYLSEFEYDQNMNNDTYNYSMIQGGVTTAHEGGFVDGGATGGFGLKDVEEEDEDAIAFMKAKKNVQSLHQAKKSTKDDGNGH